jgi:hypothetical protein
MANFPIWGVARDIPERMPPMEPSFNEWGQLLGSNNKIWIPTYQVSWLRPETIAIANHHQDGVRSPVSCLGNEEHWSSDEIDGFKVSFQLLFEAQQAGENIAQPRRWDNHLEFWELMAVESTAGPDEAALQLLIEEDRVTAEKRKRKREKKEEEPLARPIKRLRRW